MNDARWRRLSEIFDQALERPPDQRAAFLAEACEGDEELRQELEALLASYEKTSGLLDRPNHLEPLLAAEDWGPPLFSCGQRALS